MSSRLELFSLPLKGLTLIQRNPVGDHRGYFERLFCEEELRPLLNGKHIVQMNHTLTATRGTVRGMHFQHPPHSEIKIVSCLRGEIFDVAVDLRQGSPTFLQWHAEVLSATNHKSLFIPEGFAHGFQALTENCELIYCHTALYQPDAEGGLNIQDPKLHIRWPQTPTQMSARDTEYPFLTEGFAGLII